MHSNSTHHNCRNCSHNLRQNEIDKWMEDLKEGTREVMHEHRLTQGCLEIVTGYNQSTIQRYLDPHDTLTPKLFFPMLLADDEFTKPLAMYYVRALAECLGMDLSAQVDRKKLNGSIEDEEIQLVKDLGSFIAEVENNPTKKIRLLKSIERMELTLQQAKAEILHTPNPSQEGNDVPAFLKKVHVMHDGKEDW